MKHLSPVLAIMLCLVLLAGCSRNSSDTQTPSSQIPSVEKTTLPTVSEEVTQTIPGTSQTEAPVPEPSTPENPQTDPPATVSDPPQLPQETAPDPSDISSQIEQIREWYRAIVSDPTLETVTISDAATVYLKGYDIVSIAEYRQLDDSADPAFATIHYYYHYDIPFFIFIEYENTQYDEVRLYFNNGELIRWIIDQNAPQDNVPDAQWQQYYIDAFAAQESAWIALE